MLRTRLALTALILTIPFAANAAFFDVRAIFEAELGAIVVDDYENAGYSFSQTNAVMSAVLGETQYTTTGFVDNNLVFESGGNHYYCAGCNGSFLLDFTSTSVGSAAGLYGVGIDFFNSSSITVYNAFITYGDGSTENFLFDVVTFPATEFWGVTSDLLIGSIHFGLVDGGTTQEGSFGIDNLTIGSAVGVPEPGTLALLGIGLLGLSLSRRRKAR
jgi:hypothetical protein